MYINEDNIYICVFYREHLVCSIDQPDTRYILVEENIYLEPKEHSGAQAASARVRVRPKLFVFSLNSLICIFLLLRGYSQN